MNSDNQTEENGQENRVIENGQTEENGHVYIFDNKPLLNESVVSTIQYKKNNGIAELSDFYNNIGVNRQQQNQITASLFYSIAPFHPKTIARHKNLSINPDNTIEGVFQNFVGRYFRFFHTII